LNIRNVSNTFPVNGSNRYEPVRGVLARSPLHNPAFQWAEQEAPLTIAKIRHRPASTRMSVWFVHTTEHNSSLKTTDSLSFVAAGGSWRT
jgi:hypothetical protein